ncbi:MAG: alpha/beta hydrolase [Pseudomonadota bacterium]
MSDIGHASPEAPYKYRPIAPPRPTLWPLEMRVLGEGAALAAAWPALDRAPNGDGHGVIVVPGFSTDDTSTVPLRRYLRNRGYHTRGWRNGRNDGPTQANLDAIVDNAKDLADRTGEKVSLVGWSLGGCLVREAARENPDMVRGVITMGSPFQDVRANSISIMWNLLASKDRIEDRERTEALGAPIPVPATAIFSSTDAVVAGDACRERPGGKRESIEVFASHFGLGVNPLVYYAIADRLAQKKGTWKHFEPPALMKRLYEVHS